MKTKECVMCGCMNLEETYKNSLIDLTLRNISGNISDTFSLCPSCIQESKDIIDLIYSLKNLNDLRSMIKNER